MDTSRIHSLHPAARSPRTHAEIVEYVRRQRALDDYAARGGVVTTLPPQIAPTRTVAPYLGVFEPVSLSAVLGAADYAPTMMDLGRSTARVESVHLPLSHPAVHAEYARYSDEFTAAVALLSARLQMAKRPAWPPVADDAYHAALATLGV